MTALERDGRERKGPKMVKVSLPTGFTSRELASFLARPDVVSAWLGKGARLSLVPGDPVTLPRAESDGDGAREIEPGRGVIVGSEWTGDAFELLISLAPHPGVRLCVTPRPDDGSYVRITTAVAGDASAIRVTLWVWQRALNRLAVLLKDAERARAQTRQALVVVHGVGEQRPGQTLRNFVDAIFPDSPNRRRFWKPDYVSPLIDLRTVTVPGDWSVRRPTTDVYELYWSHLIRDTTLGQVYGWAWRLLIASDEKVPPTLRRHIRGVRIALLMAAFIGLVLASTDVLQSSWIATAAGALAALPALAWALWRVARNRLILGFVGDAARYLEPLPDNIERRQEIRSAGVDLLDALHDSGRYSRIVVYGHSLGSVIAYDVLAHAWARRSRRHAAKASTSSRHISVLEASLNPRTPDLAKPDDQVIQQLQFNAWREYRRNGFDWLVSDFVTAGSPLSHARWLLNADRRTSFDDLVKDRTMPTCPPQTETVASPVPGKTRQTFTFTHSYSALGRRGTQSVLVPHHAGLFAITRWTNVYFPFEGVLTGDPIGGPLRPTLGDWISDVPLDHCPSGFRGAEHVRYTDWRSGGTHVQELTDALRLSYAPNLDELYEGLNPPAAAAGREA